jgi:hypothetical protein
MEPQAPDFHLLHVETYRMVADLTAAKGKAVIGLAQPSIEKIGETPGVAA